MACVIKNQIACTPAETGTPQAVELMWCWVGGGDRQEAQQPAKAHTAQPRGVKGGDG